MVYNWCYGRHADTSYPLLLLSPHTCTYFALLLSPPAITTLSRTSTRSIRSTAASTVGQYLPLTRSLTYSKSWHRLFPGFSILAGGLRSCTTEGSVSRFYRLSSRLPAFPTNRPFLSAASRLQPSTTLKLCGYSTSSSPATSSSSCHELHSPPRLSLTPERREPQLPRTTVSQTSPTSHSKEKKKKKKSKSRKKRRQKKMYPSSSDDDKPLARNGNRTNGTSQLSMMV